MEVKPDKKLLVKQWLTLATISLFILIVAIILQFLIPLGKGVSQAEVSVVLWPITIGVILLLWVLSVPIIILWIKNLTYFIEEDRVTIYKGILTKQQQNIPYRKITDFVLRRSLYDRFLNIGAIRIQTAGQSQTSTGYEGQLSGLTDWQNLHEELKAHLRDTNISSSFSKTFSDKKTLITDDKADLILHELKAIRKLLENK